MTIHLFIDSFFADISCGVPANGDNTETPTVSLLHQDTYYYSCLTGYWTNDSITTECLADGSLSLDSPPNCTSKYSFTTIIDSQVSYSL